MSAPAIDAAMEELADRDLVRRLPDGKVYLASPADYLVTLDGMPGLGTRVDPMGSAVTPASQHVSRRRVPEDIRQVLGLAVGQQVTVIRCTWSADGQPAALSTTYLPGEIGEASEAAQPSLGAALNSPPAPIRAAAASRPATFCLELYPPPSFAARSLRLAPGEAALTVTVSFNDALSDSPVALTTVVLRPSLFRIVVESHPGLTALPPEDPAAADDDGETSPENQGS